jgi:hypothetical protein
MYKFSLIIHYINQYSTTILQQLYQVSNFTTTIKSATASLTPSSSSIAPSFHPCLVQPLYLDGDHYKCFQSLANYLNIIYCQTNTYKFIFFIVSMISQQLLKKLPHFRNTICIMHRYSLDFQNAVVYLLRYHQYSDKDNFSQYAPRIFSQN